jgi:hypothetical protein
MPKQTYTMIFSEEELVNLIKQQLPPETKNITLISALATLDYLDKSDPTLQNTLRLTYEIHT